MSRSVLILVVALSTSIYGNNRTSFPCFLYAIRVVESGDNLRAPDGADGEIGVYQITRAYWEDSGVSGAFSDCRRRAYAERVMVGYWKRYCPTALESNDFETLSRIHNGGPHGDKHRSTRAYWIKVRRIMLDQGAK